MPESRKKMVVYEVTFNCCECGELMHPRYKTRFTYPPTFLHECANGHRKWLAKNYPTVEMEPGEQHTGSGG